MVWCAGGNPSTRVLSVLYTLRGEEAESITFPFGFAAPLAVDEDNVTRPELSRPRSVVPVAVRLGRSPVPVELFPLPEVVPISSLSFLRMAGVVKNKLFLTWRSKTSARICRRYRNIASSTTGMLARITIQYPGVPQFAIGLKSCPSPRRICRTRQAM